MSEDLAVPTDICAVMVGDRIQDGAGCWWTISNVEHSWNGEGTPKNVLLVVERDSGGTVESWPMVIRMDPRAKVPQRPVIRGPGWDIGAVRSDCEDAMRWASGVIADRLGGVVISG